MRLNLPCWLLLLAVTGCGHPATPPDAEPGPTYQPVLRDWKDHEKTRVVHSGSGREILEGAFILGTDRVVDFSFKYEYTEEVLERQGDRAVRVRRDYTTAQTTKSGFTRPEVYQNSTVLIDYFGGEYRFRFDGGRQLVGEETFHLLESYSNLPRVAPEERLPRAPVRLNERWPLARDVALRMFTSASGMTLDPARTSVTGELTRVYQQGDRQHGTLVFRGDIGYTGPGQMYGPGATLLPGGHTQATITVDTCIDGPASDLTLRTALDSTYVVKPPGGGKATRVRQTGTVEASIELLK